ncbi:MAG: sulfide/dihydroorotate dehydrogenase-like FAD/NAD-binding protein [Candidatus Brocadiia bacterium]
MAKVVSKVELVPNTVEMWLEAPRIAKKRKAGQFVIVRSCEEGERIPLTIADADPEAGTICIIFQVVGRGTRLLGQLNGGDDLLDLVGPLGRPTHVEKKGNVVCIGGGLGIGPVHPIAQANKAIGNNVTAIIGARSKNLLIMEEKMRAASNRLIICTDDGTYGTHGFVTSELAKLIEGGEKIEEVIAIGPAVMMRAVVNITKPKNIPTTVSLNSLMVDGTGMCGACRVTVGGKTRFTCVDGPEFNGLEVDFDELMKRLRTYDVEEKQAQQLPIH